jgi:pimeloyl-ACP methyl ester carboxylesterase
MAALYILLALIALFALALACLAFFTALTAKNAERLTPPAGRFLDIGGARIHYLDLGEGPPIVLIHGLYGQLQHFTYALTALLTGHRLIVFDRPGCGYSLPRPAGTAGVRAQAAILAKAIGMLKLERPLIVGHSLGGAVALALAVDHPEAVGGLALIAPLTQSGNKAPEAFKALVIPSAFKRWLVSWTMAVPMTMLNGPRMVALIFAPELAPMDFAAKGGGFLGLRPSAFRTASGDMMATPVDVPGLASRYGEIKVPVSVLYGDRDAVLNYKVHGLSMKAAIPQAQLRIMEGRGHMLPVTAPRQTAEFILEAERTLGREPR